MPPHVNKLKSTCRLCLMTTERHTRYELYVKSEVESEVPMDKDAGGVCQQNDFSNMILYEKVEFCCGIKLAPKAELPSRICGKCFYMIHMWFNFRQMSCNSQIVLASQTNIKLEDDAISANLSELQQMRNDLLKEKEIKDDEEIIVPDPEMCSDNKVSFSIEKIESERVIALNIYTNSNPKSIDEEDSRGCDSKLDSEEESMSCGRIKENISSKSQDDEIYNSYEEEQDCLAEICIEEAILRNAHREESLVNDNCNEGDAGLKHDKQKSNDQLEDKDDCNVSVSMGKPQDHQLSSESRLKRNENCNMIENNVFGEECDVNDRNDKSNQLDNRELDSKTSNSEEDAYDDKDSDYEPIHATGKTNAMAHDDPNEAIENNIDYLLAESDLDDDEPTINRRKPKNTTTQNQRSCRNKTERKLLSNQKLQNENDTIQTIENSSEICKAKESKSPRKFMCSVCGNIHTDYLLFRRHVRTHSKERPFKCEICEKGFRTPAFLKRHMVVHTHDKRFKCKYCSRRYSDASSRHRHEKTHLDNPEYKCIICGKGFIYKTVLRRHLKLHSGEKEYSCGVCNTSFALPHHLKNHIKSISHREKQKSYEALGFKVVFETRESSDS